MIHDIMVVHINTLGLSFMLMQHPKYDEVMHLVFQFFAGTLDL